MQWDKSLAISMIILGAARVCAQTPSNAYAPPNAIRVTGAGEVRTVPDIFAVSLGVHTEAPTVVDAVATNDKQVKELFRVFEAAGLTANEIITRRSSIDEAYDYESRKRTGYAVSKTFEVSLGQAELIQDLVAKALQNGANRVGDITAGSTELKKYRHRARELAFDIAKEKATKLAAQAGRALGPVLSITETGSGTHWRDESERRQALTSDTSPTGLTHEATISSGSLSITADLVIDFALQ